MTEENDHLPRQTEGYFARVVRAADMVEIVVRISIGGHPWEQKRYKQVHLPVECDDEDLVRELRSLGFEPVLSDRVQLDDLTESIRLMTVRR